MFDKQLLSIVYVKEGQLSSSNKPMRFNFANQLQNFTARMSIEHK